MIKKMSNGIVTSDEWKAKEADIMKEIVHEKFRQNPLYRKYLISSPHKRFYENTLDSKWGIGLKYKGSVPPTGDLRGQNIMGKILGEVKQAFITASESESNH